MYRKRLKTSKVLKPSTSYSSLTSQGSKSSLTLNSTSSSRRSPSPTDLFEDSPDNEVNSPLKKQKLTTNADSTGIDTSQNARRFSASISPIPKTRSKNSKSKNNDVETTSDITTSPVRNTSTLSTKNSSQKKHRDADNDTSDTSLLGIPNTESPIRNTSNGSGKTNSKTLPFLSKSPVHKLLKVTSQSKAKSTANKILNMSDADDILEMLSSPKVKPTTPKRRKIIQPKTYMEEVLSNAGLVFSKENNGSYNVLSADQAVFVRDVLKSLTCDKRKRDTKQCVDNFMDDLEKFFTDKDNLKLALTPTKTDPECNIARGEFQDSLVKLLLSVDLLQHRLLEFLLDKIAEFTAGDVTDDMNDNEIGWTRMILQQLRYMNKVINSESITQRLFDVIHSTENISVQREIINCLPDIIGDDQRKQVADELIDVLRSEKALTGSVLIALENLCLEEACLEQLQVSLIKTLRNAPLDHVPAFVKFILSANSTVTDEILNGLRSELIIFQVERSPTQVTFKPSDLACTQLLVFEKLRDAILKSRKLGDTWLKNIAKINTHNQHKPLDIIMLLIIHSTSADQLRKKSVETAIKQKIKTGVFKENLIKDTFNVSIDIMKQHFKDLLKIASVLLQSADIISSFGAFIYMECFISLEPHWRKCVLLELVDQARMSAGRRAALSLLHSLTLKHTQKVSPFIILIMMLVECVTEMSVVETRELMDILCLVAFGDAQDGSVDTSGLQDEIYMLVQKQLASPDVNVFRSGVVCTVMAIKHMISVPEGQSNDTPEVSSCSEEENIVLSSRSKKAFTLLELVLNGTRSNGEALVLTHDQLSFIFMDSSNSDKSFIKKVSNLMQGSLQHHFIIASSDFKSPKDGLEARLEYCLDSELDDPIALNLTEAVVRSSNGSLSQMCCTALPGLVRVIRSLEKNDLSEIDALLGCALVFPDPSLFNKFSIVEPYIQRLALDSLFHAVNWFREIINTFIGFIQEEKPEKLVKRLKLLVQLEGLIGSCLPQAINYQPPNCYFTQTKIALDKVKRGVGRSKGTKKGKTREGEEEEGDEQAEEDESGDEKQKEVIATPTSAFRLYLREMDLSVSLMLSLPLSTQSITEKEELGPKELMFILDDLLLKMNHVLGSKKSGRTNLGFDNIDSIPVSEVVKQFAKLSPHLVRHLQQLVEHSHKVISVHDNIWDAPGMFAPGMYEVKQCLSLILSCFDTFLSWPSIRNDVYSSLVTNVLMKLSGMKKEKAKSLNVVLQACVTYLKDISNCVMDLSCAVNLVFLIKTLITYQDDSELSIEIDLDKLCEGYLRRRWYDNKGAELKGPQVSRLLGHLLEVYLRESDKIRSVVGWLTAETETLEDEPSLTTFPHFNKTNLNILISGICKGLVGATRQGLEGKGYSEQLAVWDECFSSLQSLTLVLKAQDTKLNLRHFLKGCLPILKLFTSQGINVCSCMFKMESQLVTQLLKKLQVVTRYVQTVCNYSKVSKDSGMIQQLPLMRGCLESILLAVKNMVLHNKCTDAFFMGAMRNKGLKGEIINTQEEEEEEENGAEEGAASEAGGSQSSQDNRHEQSISDAC